MAHRLDPLLRPQSVAVIGASDNNDSMGEWALRNLLKGGFRGRIFPVNPSRAEVQGVTCYASVAELPETPDLAIFAVGDHRIEAALDEIIGRGIRAAVIMSTLYLDDDATPPLRERIAQKILRSKLLACGANGMGYYNVRDGVWACGFDSADHPPPGNVALISQSGSGMSGLIDSEQRLRINLAVSTGNEIGVTMDQYLDFALDLPETRAVGLFIETARNPDGFVAALEKAARRKIPIVAIKVGRTEASARLAVSHSGTIAGDDATYEALFDRYGVQRVRDMDELANTLILFAELGTPGPGGLVSLHDSGGERQLMVDLCDVAGVPLTDLEPATADAVRRVIDPELPAVNPLDAWSRGGPGAGEQMATSLALMMQDPGAALGAVVHDRAPYGKIYESYVGYLQTARDASGKPVALVSARQGSGFDAQAVTSTHAGFPVLDGVPAFLAGVRALFAHRDFLARGAAAPPVVDAGFRAPDKAGEAAALQMLADAGLPTVSFETATNERAAVDAANALGYPVVLKTAAPGLAHKSDVGGVKLCIATDDQVRAAYSELSALGDDVIVARMAPPGVEMMLGARLDPQFGPVVLIGFGGIYAETLGDTAFALPPFDASHARRCVERLTLRALLDGRRGRPAADVDAFCELAARFSVLVERARGEISEIDLNPVIVHASGCTIVDALIIGLS